MKPARRARRPQRRRKIIVWIATSADGYIARPDGGVEWLDRPRPKGNYGMGAFVKSIDTILWGRKTYEVALGFTGREGPDPVPVVAHFAVPAAKWWADLVYT